MSKPIELDRRREDRRKSAVLVMGRSWTVLDLPIVYRSLAMDVERLRENYRRRGAA